MGRMIPVPPPRTQPDRVFGVDLTRGVAIVAMVIAHVRVWSPYYRAEEAPTAVVLALAQINNLASPLFALVMGISVGLVARRASTSPRSAARRDIVRGLVLIVIGLLLVELHTFVAIVLQPLGVTLIVGTLLARLPTRLVALVTGVSLLVAPVVNAAARSIFATTPRYGGSLWDQALQWVVLYPHYRMTNLLPLFLIGVIVARMRFERRLLTVLLVAGAACYLAFVALTALGYRVQESGDHLDTLSDLGLAVTVAAGLLLLSPLLGDPVRAALRPVVGVGTVALSAYVFHVALIALLTQLYGPSLRSHWVAACLGVLVSTVALGWLWWRTVGVGPLERLMALVARPVARAG